MDLTQQLEAILHKKHRPDLLAHLTDLIVTDVMQEWTITSDPALVEPYHIDSVNRTLSMREDGSSAYFAAEYCLNLIEALRLVGHIERVRDDVRSFHPEGLMRLTRLCMADAAAYTVLMAWRLKMDNEDQVLWKHVLCGDYSDIAQQFARVWDRFHLHPGFFQNDLEKKSLAAAFHQWFSDTGRMNAIDRDTLDYMDELLWEDSSFGNRFPKAQDVACHTLYGADQYSYLTQQSIADVTHDPYYSTIHDTVTQTHLMQIIAEMNKFRVGGLLFNDRILAERFV